MRVASFFLLDISRPSSGLTEIQTQQATTRIQTLRDDLVCIRSGCTDGEFLGLSRNIPGLDAGQSRLQSVKRV